MAEELRAGSQKRRDRWLVDVSPRWVKATDDKVQFVAEEAVMRIAGEMDCQGNERRRKRQTPETWRMHSFREYRTGLVG